MGIEEKLGEKAKQTDRKIEEYIPRRFDERSADKLLGTAAYGYDYEAFDSAISKPIWELLDRGGKRWRPALFMLVAEAFGMRKEDAAEIAWMIEVIHDGSLVVDDIEDSSELRRGKPCLHKVYGLDVAINAGNAMYFLPLSAFIRNKGKYSKETMLRAYEIYAQEMINIHFGQGMDIAWHRSPKEITENQYMQMCAYKTGTLARMAAKLAAAFAGQGEEIVGRVGRLAESIGVGFQIQDDILDVTADREKFGKAFGNDVTEGKITLMAIHAMQRNQRAKEILSMHTKDESLIGEYIGILRENGSIDYAKEKAREIVRAAWENAKDIIPESAAKKEIEELVTYLVERNY